MHPRYARNPVIKEIWTDENKLRLWQATELAVIDARGTCGEILREEAETIRQMLESIPIDLEWWKKKDTEVGHDLIAFVEERQRHLHSTLKRYFHGKMTSYDTEEPAFAKMLLASLGEVEKLAGILIDVLIKQAEHHRFTVMLGETHGQWAELQTFGKRVATWLKAILISVENLKRAKSGLDRSKLSGAIGNSPDLSDEIQRVALASLGFLPFYGATQIIPREVYAPVASALGQLVATIVKIATDIRLNARSGRTLMREPFGKSQRGSSRMPHKRNTITLEQMGGMLRMAEGYVQMIVQNIQTWHERGIEQSCVERVAWPDLFFVTTHTLTQMTKVLENLQVYPDQMLCEVLDCAGVYAASKVADFLEEVGLECGLSPGAGYSIVQLAAFGVLEPNAVTKLIRTNECTSYAEAQEAAAHVAKWRTPTTSIQDHIPRCILRPSEELAFTTVQTDTWNSALGKIFCLANTKARWEEIFSFSYNLRGEAIQIDNVLAKARSFR
ncbi:MAG: lyase family protein [Patescibacteria group bacterium]